MPVQPFGSYDDAVRLARLAHGKQADKAGRPYIGHVLRVSEPVRSGEASNEAVVPRRRSMMFWKTPSSPATCCCFSARVGEIVEPLTRRRGVLNEVSYARIRTDADARAVKMTDI